MDTGSPLLDTLTDDLLKYLFQWLYDSGRYGDLRALRLTSKKFLALTQDACMTLQNDTEAARDAVDRLRSMKQRPLWAYLDLWNMSGNRSVRFRDVVMQHMAELAAVASAPLLVALVPRFLVWIRSCKPEPKHRMSLLQPLLRLVQGSRHGYPHGTARNTRLLEQQIVRAGDGWRVDETKQQAIRDLLDIMRIQPRRVPANFCAVVADGLPSLAPDEADRAWDTVAGFVVTLPIEAKAAPLFDLALCIPCLSAPKQPKAFEWIAAKATAAELPAAEQCIVLHGFSASLDCLPLEQRLSCCHLLKPKVMLCPALLPAYGVSLTTLAPKDRALEFTQVFELELPDDPIERVSRLSLLCQWVEFLDTKSQGDRLSTLVTALIETPARPRTADGPPGIPAFVLEAAISGILYRADAFDAGQTIANIPTYLRMIRGLPCSTPEMLNALLATVCSPANKHSLGNIFEAVLDQLNSDQPGAGATAAVALKWSQCHGAVARFLPHVPANAFHTVGTRLVERLTKLLKQAAPWTPLDSTKILAPVQEALVQLLEGESPFAAPSEAQGAYLRTLLTLCQLLVGRLAKAGAALDPLLVKAFAARTHLLPEGDQLPAVDTLLEGVPSAEHLPIVFDNGVRFAGQENRARLHQRLAACLSDPNRRIQIPAGQLMHATLLAILDKLDKSIAPERTDGQ